MKVSTLSLIALAGSVSATIPISSVSRKTSGPSSVVPGEYIVEMTNLQGLGGKRSFESPHAALYSSMRKRGIPFDVKNEFNKAAIMVGASLKLANPDDVTAVAAIPGVTAIRPVIRIPAPKRLSQYVATSPSDPNIPPDSESTHKMTGVDNVHAQGIDGLGIKIGIIDTGIDYNHPALGGGFGAGFKVIGGYDFVGDAYTGENDPVEDDDPLDECNGHGTHVAGIIGANSGNPFGILGVAYNASISSYRLFGCSGSVTDDIIVKALLKGHDDGNDILTLSLGGVDGWTESSSSVVAARIAQAGTVVTIAAGNDGAYGGWYASSPGDAVSAISVASVDNTAIPVQNATVSGDVAHDPIPYLEGLPLVVNGTHEVYATSTDTSVADDACNALPDSTPDLSDKIVIVRRGTCTFTQKLDNIAAKGGKVALIYNNGGSFSPISVGNYTAALISDVDGAFLVNSFAAGKTVSLTFPQSGAAFDYPAATGGLVSDFSTYGPTYDMFFKPAVAAPGGNILSTLPLKLGGYGVESGTSMATPFTAGSAALILQAKGRGKSTALAVRDLLQTTAVPVESSTTGGDPLQTVAQQGAGLIHVDSAINYQTKVWPGQLTLNDTAHFGKLQTFWIQNTGKKTVTYTLSHVPAGTAQTISSGLAVDGPVPLTADYATVKLSANKLILLPGMALPVIATFTAPKADASALPVYGGFIKVAGAGETLQVTYMGLAASIKDAAVLDTTDSYFGIPTPALLDAAGDPVAEGAPANYSMQGDDVPTVIYRLAFGSPHVRADLVGANSTVASTVGLAKRAWWSWWWDALTGSGAKSSFAAVPVVGTLAEYEYAPRNSDGADATDNGYNAYTFDGTFANGTEIAPGSYKVLVRALKVTGDPADEKDYEVWVSPAFTLA